FAHEHKSAQRLARFVLVGSKGLGKQRSAAVQRQDGRLRLNAPAGQGFEEVTAFARFFERREHCKGQVADHASTLEAGNALHGPVPDRETALAVECEDAGIAAFEQTLYE